MHSNRLRFVTLLGSASAACAALLLTGCMQSQEAPALSGPSGYGLSLTLSAAPAVLPRDGSSQSIITVTARDGSGEGVPNVRLVASVSPQETPLAQINAATGTDGIARFQLTAPTQSTVAANNEVVISIAAVGDDFLNAVPKIMSVGLLGPSNTTYPTPDFTISPAAPTAGAQVVFDAAPTTDEGVICSTCNYVWSIQGETQEGRVAVYTFPSAGAYAVTLTVTDATGSAKSITQAVEIAAPAETTP